MSKTATTNPLDDFTWEEQDGFFGVGEVENPPAPKKEEKEKTEDEEPAPKGKAPEEKGDAPEGKTGTSPDEEETEETEDNEDLDFFSTGSEEEEEEEETEQNTVYKDILSSYTEQGLLGEDEEIPEELDSEKFFEIQERVTENKADEIVKNFLTELDDDAASFLKYKRDGGDTAEFFKHLSNKHDRPTGDIDDESYQEKLVKFYSKKEGLQDEEIQDRVEWLKDKGRLEKYAIQYEEKLDKQEKEAEKALAEGQKEQVRQLAENKRNFVSTVKTNLDKVTEVNGITFSSKDKKELLNYITKEDVKIGGNRVMSKMQSDLQKTIRDPEKMLLLAKFLNSDFDIEDQVAKKVTNKTRKTRKSLSNKGVQLKSSGVSKKKGLLDFDF